MDSKIRERTASLCFSGLKPDATSPRQKQQQLRVCIMYTPARFVVRPLPYLETLDQALQVVVGKQRGRNLIFWTDRASPAVAVPSTSAIVIDRARHLLICTAFRRRVFALGIAITDKRPQAQARAVGQDGQQVNGGPANGTIFRSPPEHASSEMSREASPVVHGRPKSYVY